MTTATSKRWKIMGWDKPMDPTARHCACHVNPDAYPTSTTQPCLTCGQVHTNDYTLPAFGGGVQDVQLNSAVMCPHFFSHDIELIWYDARLAYGSRGIARREDGDA